jgi:hypothetical protein
MVTSKKDCLQRRVQKLCKKKLIVISLSDAATMWQVENISSDLLNELGNKENEYEESI